MYRSTITLIVSITAALLLAGCAAPGPTAQNFLVRHATDLPRDAVFARAEVALLELGYQIDRADSAEGVLTTQPVMGAESAKSASGFGLGRVTVRTVAEVRVQAAETGSTVFCRVRVEQLATASHAAFLQDRGASDLPSQTPIDREGATTEEQNAVWTMIRRDRAKERAIIGAILDETP
jgi:hypothetical protein